MPVTVIYAATFLGLIVFFYIVSRIEYNKEKNRFRQNIKKSYGTFSTREYDYDEYERISHYFLNHTEVSDYFVDDITWNDLDMDKLYQQMNQCHSSAGDSMLYYMLRRPSDKVEVLKERERQITWFEKNKKQREEMQFLFARMGRTKKIAFSDYMDNLMHLGDRSNLLHYICLLLIPLSIGVFVIQPALGLVPIVMVLLFNAYMYSKKKAEVEPYVICFEYILRMLDMTKHMQKMDFNEMDDKKQDILKRAAQFHSFQAGAGLVMSMGNGGGSLEEAIMMYLRMLFHFDLIKFNQMLKFVRTRTAECEELFSKLGELEACISIASFRQALPFYAVPTLRDTNDCKMELEEVYHPLIENAVSNSIEAEKGVLITGSNASGKSTFLKVVAINALFSQTIHTAIARNYIAPIYHIYSSMSLRDSIQGGDSYYMVEIKSLKRIMEAPKDKPVLCFVDEVLRGTNTVERIAASTEILKSLSGEGYLCFAATHDIELTHLLEQEYENYHFKEEIVDEDVLFSYQIYKGRATSRNAIQLLRIMGYDKKIVYNAEKRAEEFLKQGIWR